jgi:hypothetical protein
MNRRDVLRSVGSGLATTAGVTGVASAATNHSLDDLHDPRTVRGVLAEHADVLDDLVADGVIAPEEAASFGGTMDEIEATTMRTTDGLVPAVKVARALDTGRLLVGAIPATGVSFAVFRDADGETETYGGAAVTEQVNCEEDCTESCSPDCELLCTCTEDCPIEPTNCCSYDCSCDCFEQSS